MWLRLVSNSWEFSFLWSSHLYIVTYASPSDICRVLFNRAFLVYTLCFFWRFPTVFNSLLRYFDVFQTCLLISNLALPSLAYQSMKFNKGRTTIHICWIHLKHSFNYGWPGLSEYTCSEKRLEMSGCEHGYQIYVFHWDYSWGEIWTLILLWTVFKLWNKGYEWCSSDQIHEYFSCPGALSLLDWNIARGFNALAQFKVEEYFHGLKIWQKISKND